MLLLPYLLIAAGLVCTLALFLVLKRDIGRNARRQSARLEELSARLIEKERAVEPPQPAPVPISLRAGMNLNRRVHALRMLRRGEDVNHVAAALGVPRREVELLIRVQAIGKARIAGAGAD
jgi:hypothetical protein